jgi:hypothetical protein
MLLVYFANILYQFQENWFLPEALINFIVLLWRHPSDDREFFTIKAKRIKVKEKLITIDLKIRELNIELSFKNTLKLEIEYYLKHNRSLEGKEDLKKIEGKLKELKKKYKDFAKDRTRIASLRIMASELTEEIDKILEL